MKKTIFLLIFSALILPSFGQKNIFSDPMFSSLPRTVNLQSDLPPVKDQDLRNSCTYFALTAMLEAEIKRLYGREINLSEEYLIYQFNNPAAPLHDSKAVTVMSDTTDKVKNDQWDRLYADLSGLNGAGSARQTGIMPGKFEDSDLKINCMMLMAQAIGVSVAGEEQWPYHPSFSNRSYPCGFNMQFDHTPDFCTKHFTPPAKLKEKAFVADYRIGFFGYPGLRYPEKKAMKELFAILKFLAIEKRPLVFYVLLDNVQSDTMVLRETGYCGTTTC